MLYRLTREQKEVLEKFASRYAPDVYALINRAGSERLLITDGAEANKLKWFSQKVCEFVWTEFPGDDEESESLYQDAVLASNLLSSILMNYRNDTGHVASGA